MIRFPPPSTSRRFAIGLTFLATILWIAGFNAQADNRDEPPAVGDRAPALELEGYNSETVKLEAANAIVLMVYRGPEARLERVDWYGWA